LNERADPNDFNWKMHKPIQIIESGVVAPPTWLIASMKKLGKWKLNKNIIIPSKTAIIFGLRTMLLKSFGVILRSKSQIP